MDLQARIDELLANPKTILGAPRWKMGQRVEVREMKRVLLENGEARGATLVSQAYPTTHKPEYRHMIIFTQDGGRRSDGRCVCRLDNAPEMDGPHINDFNGPLGYPACDVGPVHYHDWAGNRHLTKANELPKKLLYAREITSRFNNIDDAFWWFCQKNQVVANSWDVPGWPPSEQLI